MTKENMWALLENLRATCPVIGQGRGRVREPSWWYLVSTCANGLGIECILIFRVASFLNPSETKLVSWSLQKRWGRVESFDSFEMMLEKCILNDNPFFKTAVSKIYNFVGL